MTTQSMVVRSLASIVCILLTLSVHAQSTTPERVVWEKKPITLHIQRGQERIIHFPDEIRYWLPDSLKNKVTALAANGVLYLQAHAEFPSTRIRVQGLNSQHIYLLDVYADDSISVNDELIVLEADQVINKANNTNPNIVEEDWRVRLTRYAAHQLYAPERLLQGDASIKRIAVNTTSIPLFRGNHLETTPIAAWQGGGLFVTAVKVINHSQNQMAFGFNSAEKRPVIDLASRLRGHWLTATPQHLTLDAFGSDADSTVLYLISEQPFAESIDVLGENPNG